MTDETQSMETTLMNAETVKDIINAGYDPSNEAIQHGQRLTYDKTSREAVYVSIEHGNGVKHHQMSPVVRSWAREKGFEEDIDAIKVIILNSPISDKLKTKLIGAVETTFSLAQIALIHSELSEAAERIRKPGSDDHLPDIDGVTAELADAEIRINHFNARHDKGTPETDLDRAIGIKMMYNEGREHKHGKKA